MSTTIKRYPDWPWRLEDGEYLVRFLTSDGTEVTERVQLDNPEEGTEAERDLEAFIRASGRIEHLLRTAARPDDGGDYRDSRGHLVCGTCGDEVAYCGRRHGARRVS